MADDATSLLKGPDRRPALRRRWALLAAGCSLVLLAVAAVLPLDEAPVVEGHAAAGGWGPYVVVCLLIFGDAVIAVLPGETTLNVAATMAASGVLQLGYVIVAGAVGAVVGDSTLYAIARRMRPRVQRQLDAATANRSVAKAKRVIGTSAPALLVFGRYLPGMRFVVNATLGLEAYPYRSFLPWSIVGGVTWSVYCSTVAYLVGTALVGYPVASIVVSALASSVAVAVVVVIVLRRLREEPEG